MSAKIAKRLTLKTTLKPKEKKKKINFGPRWDTIKRTLAVVKMPQSKPRNPIIIQPDDQEISVNSIHLYTPEEKRKVILENLQLLTKELENDEKGEKKFWKYKRKISKIIDYSIWRKDYLRVYQCLKCIEKGEFERNSEEKISIFFNEKVKTKCEKIMKLMNEEYLWVVNPSSEKVKKDGKFEYFLKEKSSFFSRNLTSEEPKESLHEEEIELNFDQSGFEMNEEDFRKIDNKRKKLKERETKKIVFDPKSSEGMIEMLMKLGMKKFKDEDDKDSSFLRKREKIEKENQRRTEYLNSKKPLRLTEDFRDPKLFRKKLLEMNKEGGNELAQLIKTQLEKEDEEERKEIEEMEKNKLSKLSQESDVKLDQAQKRELVKMVDKEKFEKELKKEKNSRFLLLSEHQKAELKLHYVDLYNSFDTRLRKMFPNFNQYYGYLMSKCCHPLEWKNKLHDVDEIILQNVRKEKARLDEIKRLEDMKSESSVDWEDFRILGGKYIEEYEIRKERLAREKEEEELRQKLRR